MTDNQKVAGLGSVVAPSLGAQLLCKQSFKQLEPLALLTCQLSSWLVVLQMVLHSVILAAFGGAVFAWRCHAS